MESLIAQDVAERHDDGQRRAAVMRQVRGPRRPRAPVLRHRLARRLVAFACHLDPQRPARDDPRAPTSTFADLSATSSRRAA